MAMDQWSTTWQIESTNGNSDEDTATVMSALLPSPFHFKADGTPFYNADYLTGEPTETTVGGKQTITYELNPKGVWSDGTPITYKDWAANWKSLSGTDAAFAPAGTTGYSQISSVVQGKDQYEVVVTFSSPFADWKSLFGDLYPASEVATPDDFNKKLTSTLGVSGGPFMQGSMSQTDKSVTLVPNPKWWGDAPLLSSISFATVSANDQPQAFANGEVDTIDVGPNAAGLKTAKGSKNGVILTAGGPQYRQLTVNGASPILSDQSVRQAIAESLNRSAIAQSDLAGMGVPETVVDSHFFMPNQDGYTDNAAAVGKYDTSAAEQLLTQAGWTQAAGSQYRTKAGKELDLNLLIPQDVSVASNEATLITAMLKVVGIKVTTSQEGDNFFTDINAGKFDMTVFSWTLNDFPVSGNVALYQSDKAQGGTWGDNFTHLGSTALDTLLQNAVSAQTQADETTTINQADQQIWQEAGLIPFYQRPEIQAQVKNLANYGAFGFADIVWQNVGFTK